MLERDHLVPTICQLVPGTFISLIIIPSHSAAQFALEEIAAHLERPAQSHMVAEQELLRAV